METERDRFLAQEEAIRDAQRVPVVHVSLGCTGHGKVGYIHSYAVQETWHGQFSRGMVYGLSCGGTVLAGYPVPRTWTPGLKVLVRWKPDGREWVQKTTTIPPYDDAGMLYVHFFPNDEVRVVVSRVGTQNPGHPIPPTAIEPPPEIE
ncbi:DUF3304 domain-containing protein [Xylophilus sp. GOD-11R]|uniref:DUF3304 domain-containing protein n=1 Tax=Xylophilus sp. GOD-11R TaxID=3089814 RepID=UPI00298C1F5C|nr:DUF3304 domain-containing protein [Xylophilus sp. GOD-11R]WPB55349.1 DUF3304 domain-containing protein [Xylophilus sp. GOD-11R]